MTLTIDVHLHTVLRYKTSQGVVRRVELTMPVGSRISDVLQVMQIDYPRDALLFAINGLVAGEEDELHGGDRLDLMPAISGGELKDLETSDRF